MLLSIYFRFVIDFLLSYIISDKIQRLDDGTILPLIWIEITSGDFTPEILDTLYASTFGLNLIEYSLKYGTLLMSILSFGLIVAGFYYLAKRRERYEMKNEKILSAELRALQSVDLTSAGLSQLQQQAPTQLSWFDILLLLFVFLHLFARSPRKSTQLASQLAS